MSLLYCQKYDLHHIQTLFIWFDLKLQNIALFWCIYVLFLLNCRSKNSSNCIYASILLCRTFIEQCKLFNNIKQHFIFYWAKIIRSFKNPKSVFFSSKPIENTFTTHLYFLSKRCTQTTWREPLITCAMMLLFSAFFTLSISVKLKYDCWMTLLDQVIISFRSNLNNV